MIDLHIHTTASDGSYSPSGIVSLAKKSGISAVAITDHDTVDGVEEAVLAGRETGIEVVPGVEISVGGTDNMHILGLYVNHKNKAFEDKLYLLKESRKERNIKMIKNLNKFGFDISYDEIASETGAKNLGRLHIAQFIQKKGLVSDYRKIFNKYIIKGGQAYVSRKKLSEKDGLETIINAGGLPFLAHINYFRKDNTEIENIIKRLKGYGLAGIEAYYSGYNIETQNFANAMARKYDLLMSGGTDFHGAHRSGVEIGRGRGDMNVPYSLLEKIKQAAHQD